MSASPDDCRAVLVDQWGRAHGLGDVTLLGRDPAMCDVAILCAWVSRRHAEIRWTSARRFVLVDLGSTNGTRADAQPVDRPAALTNGQIIEVGGVSFVFATNAVGDPLAAGTPTDRVPAGSVQLTLRPNGAGTVSRGHRSAELNPQQFALVYSLANRFRADRMRPATVRGFVRSRELGLDEGVLEGIMRRTIDALERGGLGDVIESCDRRGYRLAAAVVEVCTLTD